MASTLCNVKFFHYATGVQMRVYSKPLILNADNSNDIYDDCFFDDSSSNDFECDLRNDEELADFKAHKSLLSSRSRTMQAIYSIARANMWDYFLTLTFDPAKIDSTNYDVVVKAVSVWLSNLRRIAPDFKYILVPELHADGKKWHIHGLLADIGDLKKRLVDSGKVKNDCKIYNMDIWKYGFSTVSEIKDSGKASSYISKYITKEMLVHLKFRKHYWASRNCLKMNDVMSINYMLPEEIEEYLKLHDVKYCKTVCQPDGFNKVSYYEL